MAVLYIFTIFTLRTFREIKIVYAESRDARFIPIPGSLNFRDFGGYSTNDGGQVNLGSLYRCGSLANIPDHAHAEFADLDIGVICDLRRFEEAKHAPTPTTAPFDCRVHIPIRPGSAVQMRDIFDDPAYSADHLIEFMQEITVDIAENNLEAYRQLFTELLEVDTAFLLHCSAGKDRTGFGCAMILASLGVSEQDIINDYLLTNDATELVDLMLPAYRKRYGGATDEKKLRVIAGVKHEYLRAALDQLHLLHGSIEGYLEAIGIDQNAKVELKERLVSYA
ncbi:MAG: tyrosine-protein phosphatase [Pseudomonadales bacterium]|nr:tyrosine-protein phosphatase [Pseudomonadales bacterium]